MKTARLGLAFALAVSAGAARAQPAPAKPPAPAKAAAAPAKPEAKPAAPEKPAAPDKAEAKPAEAEPEVKPDESELEPIPEPAPPAPVGPPPAPVLPPPRADEQEPPPYTREPEAPQPMRNVDLGPDFGVAYRPASGSGVTYEAAFAWGLHARLELARWMGFRVLFVKSEHAVSIEPGALKVPGSQIHQPDLEMTLIAGRIEPTWVVMPRLRLWGGPSAGLAYFIAPVSRTTGSMKLESVRRTGAVIELGGALGATFDVIPDWLTAQLCGTAATTIGNTGDAFDPPQSFDATGNRVYMDGLPEFGGSFALMAGLGVVL
jgi:hypothetical protein